MNWTTLVERVAERTGTPKSRVHDVLTALVDESQEALGSGDSVNLYGLGKLELRELSPRTIRNIANRRKMYIGKRHTVRFKPAKRLRDIAAELTPQNWRSEDDQAAWRRAETLVADLDLYHSDQAPPLAEDLTDEQVEVRCREAFGGLWSRVARTYTEQVDAEVRGRSNYLADAARRRWST